MFLGVSVDTLPLAGRDQGRGTIGPDFPALAPPPNLPLIGGGTTLWLSDVWPDSVYPSPYEGEVRWGCL
jgi:hypothetical protein